MAERFTYLARKGMALANQEAVLRDHEYVGTEHVLLVLAKENSGLGSEVLIKLGFDQQNIRAEIEKLIKNGSSEPIPPSQPARIVHRDNDGRSLPQALPTTEHVRKAIDHAVNEARQVKITHVGTELFLLGLMRQEQCAAATLLTNMGMGTSGNCFFEPTYGLRFGFLVRCGHDDSFCG